MKFKIMTIGLCVATAACTAGFAAKSPVKSKPAAKVKASVSSPAKAKPAAAVVAPKFEEFNPATYKGKTGLISLPCDGQSMMLLRKFADGQLGDYLSVTDTKKEVALPVGKYKAQVCIVTVPGANGTNLIMNTAIGEGKDEVVDIKAGKSISLPMIESLVASTASAKTGSIVLPYDGESKIALISVTGGPNGYLQASAKSKTLTVPVGTYTVASYSSTLADKNNDTWALTVTPGSDIAARKIEIKQDQSISIDPVGSIAASITANQDGDKVSMNLQIASVDGAKCTIQRADGKGDPPGFEVVSDTGAVVMSGNFAYG